MQQNDPLREIWYWGKLVFWDMPVSVYEFFRILLTDWRTLAVHRTGDPSTLKGEKKELSTLYARLLQYEGRGVQIRRELPQRVVSRVFPLAPDKPPPPLFKTSLRLVSDLVASEGLYTIPKIDLNRKLSTVEIWDLTSSVNRHLLPFERSDVASRIEQTLETLLRNFLPEQQLELPYDEAETPLFVPVHDMLSQPAQKVQMALAVILREPPSDSLFPHLWRQLNRNTLIFSGLDPDDEGDSQKQPVLPTQARNTDTAEIIQAYLAGTPFADFIQTPLPFSIPFETRFSHTHVLGGTGHGKTQLLQHLILDDFKMLTEGKGSIVVIDSQGDLIRTITHLAEFSPSHPYSLADRLVLIDPNDTKNPPCLNLFDFGLDRLNTHDPVEQEKLKNGAIALYEYLFGALLRSEMTSRQDLVFTFFARLLMTIPGATIRTLMDLIKQPELTRQHFSKLDPVSKLFFEEEFFSKLFNTTRQSILARLWGGCGE
jgi:hypothetical protein